MTSTLETILVIMTLGFMGYMVTNMFYRSRKMWWSVLKELANWKSYHDE